MDRRAVQAQAAADPLHRLVESLSTCSIAGAPAATPRACGPIGSCAEYLYNTVSHLEDFGIRDRNLWRLQELVAHEIEALHRGAAC